MNSRQCKITEEMVESRLNDGNLLLFWYNKWFEILKGFSYDPYSSEYIVTLYDVRWKTINRQNAIKIYNGFDNYI